MQKIFFPALVLLLMLSVSSILAQEALVSEQLYFQGETIRKISVGADGIWVIKGTDSSGVARLDFQGVINDYTSLLPVSNALTGIVGKNGENVLLTTNSSLYFMQNGLSLQQLGAAQGFTATKINDVIGTPAHTRVATGSGIFESFDDAHFYQTSGSAGTEYVSITETGIHHADVNTAFEYRFTPTPESNLSSDNIFATWRSTFDTPPRNMHIYDYEATRSHSSIDLELYLAGDKGFYVNTNMIVSGNTGSSGERTFVFMKDTTAYVIKKYKHFILIGTTEGLYYYTSSVRTAYDGRLTKVELGDSYTIYDIAVQADEQTIWLATDKGVLKVVDNYHPVTNYANNSLLWAYSPNGAGREKTYSIVADTAGNFYQTGYFTESCHFSELFLTAQNYKDFYLAKYTASGEVLWVRTIENTSLTGTALREEGFRLEIDSQGNVYVLCHIANNNITANYTFGTNAMLQISGKKNLLLKYDSEGTLLRFTELPDVLDHKSLQMGIDEQDNLLLSGTTDKTQENSRFVIKTNPAGNQLWQKNFASALDKFNLGRNGKFYLTGYFYRTLTAGTITFNSDYYGNLAVIHFDAAGEPLWHNMIKGYRLSDGASLREIQTDNHGNTYIAGDIDGRPVFGAFSFDGVYSDAYFLTKLNQQGEYEWLRYSGGVGYSVGLKDLLVDNEGNSYITGTTTNFWVNFGTNVMQLDRNNLHSVYLAKFDAAGNNFWFHAIPDVYFSEHVSIDKSLVKTTNGLVLAASLHNDVRINNNLYNLRGSNNTLLLAISDTFVETPFNIIKGRSFLDTNGNLQFDTGEPPMRDHLIVAEPGPVYAKPDFQGNYQLKVGTGSYVVKQIIPTYPHKIVRQTYPDAPHALELREFGLTETGYDFANSIEQIPYTAPEILVPPAKLLLYISSTQRRRCATGYTYITVSNVGRGPAENVTIQVSYPEYVVPLQSTLPWTSLENNVLTFTIAEIAPNSSFEFYITDSVKCENNITGLEQCITAVLNYADSAEVNPDWDQSDTELAAECKDNGFVRVTIKNMGAGDMADSANFSIFLDQQKVYAGKYKLSITEELSLNILANGKALLFVAEQTAHHPEKKSVSIQVEGCTNSPSVLIHYSYESTLAADTVHEQEKIDCHPIVDSQDPNDKLAMPAGITDNHNIRGDEYLTYTIRFQNTGTASAINIRITDTLDEQLDLATLRMGGASHPVNWEVQGTTLNWRFTNIYLPDSNSNEPASHGWVKFRVKPKQGLPAGNVIRNNASIYFDYNSAVITNVVFHTIGLPEITENQETVVQNCNTSISLEQEEDQTIVLCSSNSSYDLYRNHATAGSGKWIVTKGQAILQDPLNSSTTASSLSYGENEFIWLITYCDQQVSSKVTIIREQPLAVPEIAPFSSICEGDSAPTLLASGNEEIIEWYADAALTQLVAQGPSIRPNAAHSQRYFVIQRRGLCSSPAAEVLFQVYPMPVPPTTVATTACVEVTVSVLTAAGSNIRWYADAEKQQLLGQGPSFTPATAESKNYFVTQSSEYCESPVAAVAFTAKRFDPAKAVIANVVTPNGDSKNQLYYIKDFENKDCLGGFIAIKIYNRWGNKVFESNKADFRWDASSFPTGVYYYHMQYQLQPFYGYIQVLK